MRTVKRTAGVFLLSLLANIACGAGLISPNQLQTIPPSKLGNQSANLVLSGPTTGGAAAPSFRALVAADLPALPYVTSVNVAMTDWTSSGTVTSSGTITMSRNSQAAHYILGNHTAGSAAPTYAALTTADVPDLSATYLPLHGTADAAAAIPGSGITGSHSIPDAALSTNVPLLNAANTYTGPSWLLKPSAADSVTAWQVQPKSSATPVLDVDTTNSRVGIGTASPLTALQVGTVTTNGISTANWTTIGLDSTFGNQALGKNLKMKFFQQGSSANFDYGFGISTGLFEMTVGQGGDFAFFNNGTTPTELVRIKSGGSVGIGTTSPTATLTVNGGLSVATNATAKTTTYTATLSDYTIRCDPTGGAFTVTLPRPTTNAGQILWVKNVSASATAITIKCITSGTFDGVDGQATGLSLAVAHGVCQVQSDGTDYMVLRAPAAP